MNKEVIEVIKSRTSVRKYKDQPIPKEIIEDIIDCGRLSPSGYNKQPWVFVIVTNQEMRLRFSEICEHGRFIKNAPVCVAVICKKDEICTFEDGCAATENLIIAAKAYDLGTCWVNSYQKVHSEEVKQLLNVSDDYELVTLLAVGYPEEIKQRPKKELSEVLRWESFS